MLVDKWTDFDSLRDKILQLQEKLVDLQCRADDSQKALIQKEKRRAQKNFSKSFVSKDEDNPNDTKEVDDEYCPPGWKCYLRDYSSAISTEKKQKVFYTPEGKFCVSRDKALRYIEVSGDDIAQKDKDLLRRGLFSDGWEESDYLPEGWLTQVRQHRSYFLTQDYLLVSGKKNALRHLLSRYSDADLLKFFKHFVFRSDKQCDVYIKYRTAIPYPWRAFEILDSETKSSKLHYISPDGSYHTTRALAVEAAKGDPGLSKADKESFVKFISNVRPNAKGKINPKSCWNITNSKTRKRFHLTRKKADAYHWTEDDPSLPSGWKVTKMDDGRKVFKDDQGVVHLSRRLALKSMFQRKEKFNDSDFEKMKACLVEDGFKPASFLPQDWLYKQCKSQRAEKYISADFNIYRSFEDVLGGLKSCGADDEQINHFKRNCPKQWKDGGERLPEGWMTSSVTHYKGVKMETFLSPEGKFYQGIINVLQQSYTTLSAGEREKLHSILFENGWVRDDLTPKGWLCKRYNFATSKVQWLSPEYQR